MTGPPDTFGRDNLPPEDLWPVFDFSHPAYRYPKRVNCVTRFLDRWIEKGRGERVAIVTPDCSWSYQDLYQRVNQMAHVLVDDYGLIPGNRVLLRSANNPMMLAAYLAVIRAGGIAVGTMPLLRSSELIEILVKARISHALCDERLREELEKAAPKAPDLEQTGYFATSNSIPRHRRLPLYEGGSPGISVTGNLAWK